MRDYVLYIHDDRYGTPTLDFVSARDDAGARELAEERLRITEHHLAIDVCDGEGEGHALLFQLGR